MSSLALNKQRKKIRQGNSRHIMILSKHNDIDIWHFSHVNED